MESNIGYIYISNHTSYDLYDVCKMGKTFQNEILHI